MKPANGLHTDIDRDAYDGIERTNFSLLKNIAKSAAHLHHALTEERKDTDAMKLGRAVHIAALEPERFKSATARWDGGTRRGKDWEAFKKEHDGRELLTEREHDVCLAIQKAVRGDATAMRYLSRGRGEVTLLWTRTAAGPLPVEVPCKGRVDFIGQLGIVDLKTCRDASPAAFGRQAWSLKYVTQASWYVDGHERATGVRLPYSIVAVESEAPFVVQVYTVPETLLELGREEYVRWLDQLVYCRANSVWPGYRDGETELELPAWASPESDNDDLNWDIGGKTNGQGLPIGDE